MLTAVDVLVIYLPALGAARDRSPATVNPLLTARAVAAITSRLMLGPVTRRLGRRTVLVTSLLLSSAAMATVAASTTPWVAAVALVLAGLGLGVGQPVSMAWISESAPPTLRATALSLRLAGNRLGQTFIPVAIARPRPPRAHLGVFATIAAWLAAVSATAR
ncbi:MFS transporter [Phytohabitans suffuscus]|uniref:Major facilitator superfamily (MFS) profile domain-containing protein n=1 Tax=Phytohabitans suffuscus TaxID=624315 RepID=A0A6F8Z196_9ACTN|nr:MFS transporter [Phytohabitans suffuscus]BCB92104.1 hypothetical protein Psuf_094170 [Phytohabitans suffuscus]